MFCSQGLKSNPDDKMKAALEKIVVDATAQSNLRPSGIVGTIFNYVPTMRISAVVALAIYLIPIPWALSLQAYRFALLTTVFNLALTVFVRYGKPWGMAFVQQVMDPYSKRFDYTLHRAVVAAVLVFSKPYFLGALAVMAMEIMQALLFDLPRTLPSPLAARVSKLTHDTVLPKLLGANSAPNSALPAKQHMVETTTEKYTAYLELFFGIFLILELLTPGRSIFQTLLMWQLLRMLAMFSQHTRNAFYGVDQRIRGIVGAYVFCLV